MRFEEENVDHWQTKSKVEYKRTEDDFWRRLPHKVELSALGEMRLRLRLHVQAAAPALQQAGSGTSAVYADPWKLPTQYRLSASKLAQDSAVFERVKNGGFLREVSVCSDWPMLQLYASAHSQQSSPPPRTVAKDMLRALVAVSDGCFGTQEPLAGALQLTVLRGIAQRNLKSTATAEDVRSFAFAMVLNMNMPNEFRGVVADSQVPMYSLKGNPQKADVVLFGPSAKEVTCDLITPGPPRVIVEWKIGTQDRAYAQCAYYGYQCYKGAHSRLLLWVIEGDQLSVWGQFAVKDPGDQRPIRLVRLQERMPLKFGLQRWLPLSLEFAKSESLPMATAVPSFGQNSLARCITPGCTYVVGGFFYKVYDYSTKERSGIADCERRQANIDLARKYYPKDSVDVIVDTPDVEVVRFKTVAGDHVHCPRNANQCLSVCLALKLLHEEDKCVHGDVRIANMLFPKTGDDAFLIDFDFARRMGSGPKYPSGYRCTGLETQRHPDARSQQPMHFKHDRYALQDSMASLLGLEDIRPAPDQPDSLLEWETLLSKVKHAQVPVSQASSGTLKSTGSPVRQDASVQVGQLTSQVGSMHLGSVDEDHEEKTQRGGSSD